MKLASARSFTPRPSGERHLSFWLERLRSPSFVYVLQGRPGTPIKIGYTKNPKARMRSLQTGNPQKLYLLYVIPGDRDLERNFHRRLKGARSVDGGGEWFYYGPEVKLLLQVVEELARRVVNAYDGSGKVPQITSFSRVRTEAEIKRQRRDIAEWYLDGTIPLEEIGAFLGGWSEDEVRAELKAMNASGDYDLPDFVYAGVFGQSRGPGKFRKLNRFHSSRKAA